MFHICHIVGDDIGGAPRAADVLISKQVDSGCKVSVIVLSNFSQTPKLFDAANEVICLNAASHLSSAIRLGRSMSILKPDIIICHCTYPTRVVYLSQLLKLSPSLPYIGYVHNNIQFQIETSYSKGFRKFLKWTHLMFSIQAFQQAAGLVFVCKSLQDDFIKLGIKYDRSIISYNPVRHEFFDNNSQYENLDFKSKTWLQNPDLATFVSPARLEPQKDHKTLLRAFENAKQTYPRIRLILLGEGSLRNQLEELTASLGISQEVLFLGNVSNPEVYFSLSRAVILSSHFEGFGMVLVEAVACGTTFISSDCPTGPREVSELLDCGTVIPPNDVHSLASAIIAHAESPKVSLDRTEKLHIFSEDMCMERLNDLICSVLVLGNRSRYE